MKNREFRNALFAEQALEKPPKSSPLSPQHISRQQHHSKRLKDDSDDSTGHDYHQKRRSDGGGGGASSSYQRNRNKGEEDHSPKDDYIDRAELRRQMERELFAKQSADGSNPPNVLTFSQLLGGRSQTLTAEERQMLGGDEEHTHLVSGLDSRLLEKTRLEIKQKVEAAESASLAGVVSSSDLESVKDPWARDLARDFAQSFNVHNNKFSKQIALIGEHISRGGRFKGNTAVFGRMYYLFDSHSSQPTTLFRSAASALDQDFGEKVAMTSVTVLPPALCARIDSLCTSEGGKRSTLVPEKAEGRLSEAIPSMTDDRTTMEQQHHHPEEEEDFEIFPGAGPLDVLDVVARTLQARTEADIAEQDRRKMVAKELKAQERKAVEAAERLLGSAAAILQESEALEAKETAARKRLLERPPDEPVANNPFSLKNASLLPLVNKKKPKLNG